VNHVSTAAGGPRGGPWAVDVERDGDYEVALSRWPPWQNLPLTAHRAEQKMTAGALPEGKALPITGARLSVAGQNLNVKTVAQDKAAVLRVKLKVGVKTNLHGWFQDAAGNDLSGAFYATVRRL
jgi:hypothetical protein